MKPISNRRLHIGCGGQYRDGYINVDSASNTVADIRANASSLPFVEGAFEEVELLHLLEHLSHSEAIAALSEYYRILEPGGKIIIETPDPEGSFHLFLNNPSIEKRSLLLSWVFGLDTPGYHHRLLYPFELLHHILERAGFKEIEQTSPRTHLYAPGLRIEARRADSPIHSLLSIFRSSLIHDQALDLSHQLHALEFESVFIDNLLQLAADTPIDLDQHREIAPLANILMAPAAALLWLDLCSRFQIDLPFDAGPMISLARAAVDVDLVSRIMTFFYDLCKRGVESDDGYIFIQAKGLSLLHSALNSRPGQQASILAEGFPLSSVDSETGDDWPLEFHPQIPKNALLTRALLHEKTSEMQNLGVKFFVQGRESEAQLLFERAANSRIDHLYPTWNLAVFYTKQGDLARSIHYYRQAIDIAADKVKPLLFDELFACYLNASLFQDAYLLALIWPCSNQKEDRINLARSLIDNKTSQGQPRLPTVRKHPVLAGEGLFHEPFTP